MKGQPSSGSTSLARQILAIEVSLRKLGVLSDRVARDVLGPLLSDEPRHADYELLLKMHKSLLGPATLLGAWHKSPAPTERKDLYD
jgi:hypothetical protein